MIPDYANPRELLARRSAAAAWCRALGFCLLGLAALSVVLVLAGVAELHPYVLVCKLFGLDAEDAGLVWSVVVAASLGVVLIMVGNGRFWREAAARLFDRRRRSTLDA